MTGTKNRQKSILMICCLLAVSMLAGCGAKPTDESSNALTESNATISASELVVAGNEIAIGRRFRQRCHCRAFSGFQWAPN